MIRKVESKTAKMPAVFLEWQCQERQDMFAALRRGEHPRFLASHLPVLSTLNSEPAAFPIHASTKGVGLFPKEEYLAEHVDEISDCLARSQHKPAPDTLSERIETTLSLYNRPERIDKGVFGGIEIFRGQSYRNLLADARASLLFTGFGPQYLSYQFNCDVELVEPQDIRFEFLRGMRLLFEQERFHIQQPQYPLGYVFHIREVFDKTPRIAHAGKQKACPFRGGSGTQGNSP